MKSNLMHAQVRLLIIIATLFLGVNAYAATYTLTTSGRANAQTPSNWNTGGTGGGGAAATNFSTNGDVFIIASGTAATFNGGNPTFESGVTLQIGGTANITGNGNTVTVNGTIIFTAASGNQISLAGTQSGQTIIINGTIKTANTFGVSGNNNCSLPASGGKATVTINTTDFEFNGTSAQATAGLPASINLLTINNAAGVTLSGTVTANTVTIGDVTANSILSDGGNQITCTGTLNISNTGILRVGAGTATTLPAFSTINLTAGTTIEYAASAAQAVSTGLTYQNLTFSGTGIKTVDAGTLNVSGDWSVTGGASALNTNNPTVNVTGNITGTGAITSTSGTLTITGNFTNTGTFTHNSGTVNYNGTTQTVKGVVYNNLTISGSGTKTLGAAVNVAAALTVNAGCTLALSTFNLGATNAPTSLSLACGATTGSIISGTGTLTLGGNVTVSSAGTGTSGATISCPVALGANRIVTVADDGTSAADLTMSGVINGSGFGLQKDGAGTLILSGSNSYTGATTINTGIVKLGATGTAPNSPLGTTAAGTTVASGATLDLNGFSLATAEALTLNGTGNSSAGALTNTSATATTYSGLITLGSSTTILANSGNIILSAAGTITGSGFNLILDGTATGCSLASIIGTGAGSVTKQGTGTWSLSGASTFTGGFTLSAGTVNINNSQALGGATGTFTINGGTINNTSAGSVTTVNYPLAFNSDFTFTGTQALNLGTGTATMSASRQITVSASTLTIGGTITTGSLNLTKAGAGILSFGSQTVTLNNLTISAGTINASSSTINIAGAFSNSGTFNGNTGTVNFNGSGAQSIPTATFNNLTVSNSGTKTATGALTVNGQLDVASGVTLNMGTNTLSGSTLTTGSGTGTLQTQNTSAAPLPTGRTWNMTVSYNNANGINDQTIMPGTYSGFIIDGTGNKNITGGNVTINGTLALNSGFLVVGTNTLTIGSGTITSGGGSITASGSATVIFSNSGNIALPSLTFNGAVNNLTKQNGGSITFGASQAIQGALTLTSGKVGIGSGNTLTLGGTVSGMSAANSIIGGTNANLAIAGPGALGTLFFDQTTPGTTNIIQNLTINRINLTGTLGIGNTLRITGVLQPSAGTVSTGGFLTIASSATGTGRILTIDATKFAFSGNVNVERYIKSKTERRYVFLSSAIDGVSFRDAWQDDIYITGAGTGGTPCGSTTGNGTVSTDMYNTNGFDVTTANNVTVYTYDQTNAARWVGISNTTSTNLIKGKGYRVYFRGARGDNSVCQSILTTQTPPAPTAATITTSGTLTTGDVTVAIAAPTVPPQGQPTFGYTLIGNPYACEINWSTFQADNNGAMNNKYWTHDPSSASTTGYVAYSLGTVSGNSDGGSITGANGSTIASGQAFFVERSSTSVVGTATFKESHKVNTAQNGAFRTQNNNTWDNRIRITMRQSDDTFIDNIVIRFSDDPTVTTAESDYWDVITFNSGNYLASVKGTKAFAIQTRPLNFYNDTVVVGTVLSATGEYKLNFSEYDDFTAAAQIFLIDQFTGSVTDVKANPLYPFSVTSNPASKGGRFKIVFRSLQSVMPLSFLNIAAVNKEHGTEVSWKVAFEQNVSSYTVERSDNGRDFSIAGTVASKGNSNVPVGYSFLDTKPVNGTVYYRVKSNENGSEGKYSAVVKVNSSKENAIVLYPNPVKDNLRLIMPNGRFNNITVTIRNTQGKTVMQQGLTSAFGSYSLNVSSLAAGMYFISITNEKGENLMSRVIKN